MGWIALGGLAIGYDAAGGGAIGWHSAAGGGALAGHVAVGGGALARDFAVGGAVSARDVNTDLARTVAADESFIWMLDWVIANPLAFNIGCIVFVAIGLGIRMACTRKFFAIAACRYLEW